MKQPAIERRIFNRFLIVNYVFSSDGRLIGYTRDISIGGACINLVDTMFSNNNDKSETIKIKPVTDKYSYADINLIAQYVWGDIQSGSFIGLQFKENPLMTEQIKEMISYFYGDEIFTN